MSACRARVVSLRGRQHAPELASHHATRPESGRGQPDRGADHAGADRHRIARHAVAAGGIVAIPGGASIRYSIVDAATDLSERIRANASGLGEGRDFNAYLAALSVQPPAAPAKDCSQVVCDGNEYAAWDVSQWWISMASQLPGAGVASWTSPDVSAAAGTIPAGFVSYRLELYWKEPSTPEVSVGVRKPRRIISSRCLDSMPGGSHAPPLPCGPEPASFQPRALARGDHGCARDRPAAAHFHHRLLPDVPAHQPHAGRAAQHR